MLLLHVIVILFMLNVISNIKSVTVIIAVMVMTVILLQLLFVAIDHKSLLDPIGLNGP